MNQNSQAGEGPLERPVRPVVAEARPNYKKQCISCGARPTVDLKEAGGKMQSLELCGPCTFGEARMVDPREWDK